MRSVMFCCTCPAKHLGEPSSPHRSIADDKHLTCMLNLAVANIMVAKGRGVPSSGDGMGLICAVRGEIGSSKFFKYRGKQIGIGCCNKQKDGGWRKASTRFCKFAGMSRTQLRGHSRSELELNCAPGGPRSRRTISGPRSSRWRSRRGSLPTL